MGSGLGGDLFCWICIDICKILRYKVRRTIKTAVNVFGF